VGFLADIVPVKVVPMIASIANISDIVEFIAFIWDLIASSTTQVIVISTFQADLLILLKAVGNWPDRRHSLRSPQFVLNIVSTAVVLFDLTI